MLRALPGPNLYGLSQRDLVSFVVQLELTGLPHIMDDFEVAGLRGREPEAVPAVAAALQHEARRAVVHRAGGPHSRV